MGYHLQEDFENWYHQQKQVLHLEDVTDITLTTDGIFTFDEQGNDKAIQILWINPIELGNSNALMAKINQIAREQHKSPKDDLAIIRVIL